MKLYNNITYSSYKYASLVADGNTLVLVSAVDCADLFLCRRNLNDLKSADDFFNTGRALGSVSESDKEPPLATVWVSVMMGWVYGCG